MNRLLFCLQFKLVNFLTIAFWLVSGAAVQAADCGNVCDPAFWKNADKKTLISELEKADLTSHSWGYAPIHRAVQHGDLEIIRALVDRGADVNFQVLGDNWLHHGDTPLMMAKEPEIVAYLLEHGANPSLLNRDNQNAVFSVSDIKSLHLLLQAGANPKLIDASGNSALFEVEGDDAIEMLIKLGLDPNHQNDDGETAIHANTNALAVEALLKLGAEVDMPDHDGQTPLYMTNDEVEDLLIKYGANVNHRDNNGRTPFFYASSYLSALKLVAAGADPNAFDESG